MQGHGQRRATCRCSQRSELFVVDIKDFKRILQPLQQDTLQTKIAFLQQVALHISLPEACQGNPSLVVTTHKHVLLKPRISVCRCQCFKGCHQARLRAWLWF